MSNLEIFYCVLVAAVFIGWIWFSWLWTMTQVQKAQKLAQEQYDQGYQDGWAGVFPQHPNQEWYMGGYADGRVEVITKSK